MPFAAKHGRDAVPCMSLFQAAMQQNQEWRGGIPPIEIF
jgi:hypothetical protein